MGSAKDQGLDPWMRFQQSQWQYLKSNGVCNLGFTSQTHRSTSPVFPTYLHTNSQTAGKINSPVFGALGNVEHPFSLDPSRQVKDGIFPPCIDAMKNIQMGSALSKHMRPMDVTIMPTSQRRFIIVDQSGCRTRLMFSSMNPVDMPNSIDNNLKPLSHPTFQEDLLVNNNWFENQSGTNSISMEHKVDEMHEDTEEIDALLYSDSDDEEEASPGYDSCNNTILEREEDVASSGVPAKKRRLNNMLDDDASLLDTANSANLHDFRNAIIMGTDGDDKLSSVKGEVQLRVVNTSEYHKVAIHNAKNQEEDSIRETLDALMHIIPGNVEGKDVIEVLDEAISYLKSLKAKYSVFSGSSL